jgi:hypothetical protein
MTCIHGLGSSFIGYVIYDILVSNQIETFNLLNDHEPDFDHKTLTLTLNFSNGVMKWPNSNQKFAME